jgi:hypothetical protein
MPNSLQPNRLEMRPRARRPVVPPAADRSLRVVIRRRELLDQEEEHGHGALSFAGNLSQLGWLAKN